MLALLQLAPKQRTKQAVFFEILLRSTLGTSTVGKREGSLFLNMPSYPMKKKGGKHMHYPRLIKIVRICVHATIRPLSSPRVAAPSLFSSLSSLFNTYSHTDFTIKSK